MAVILSIKPDDLLGSQLITGLLADVIGVTATSNKARVAAVAAFIKGKSSKQLVEIVRGEARPTHVYYINPDDEKTSDVCKKLVEQHGVDSGNPWKIGDPDIKVPSLHFGCRSSLSYVRL